MYDMKYNTNGMRPSYGIKNLKTQNSAKAPVCFENAGLKMHHIAAS